MDAHSISLVALAITVLGALLGGWNSAKKTGEQIGEILTSIAELRGEVRTMDATRHGEIALVDQTASSAHKRIDGIADQLAERTPYVGRPPSSRG